MACSAKDDDERVRSSALSNESSHHVHLLCFRRIGLIIRVLVSKVGIMVVLLLFDFVSSDCVLCFQNVDGEVMKRNQSCLAG